MADSKRTINRRELDRLEQLIADIESGQNTDRPMTVDGRDLAAVMLGRRGGLKGGRARADSLSPERRQEIARRAAAARWSK